jgi:hypothetical protein
MFLLIIATITIFVSVRLIPKRIPIVEMYTTSYFASFFAALTDIYLDGKLDLYGFFKKGIDWEYIPIFIIIYPATSILFLNFFPYGKSFKRKVLYIFQWTIVTVTIEYIALHTQVYYYNGWKLIYSALCYPVVYLILYLNLQFTRRLSKIKK